MTWNRLFYLLIISCFCNLQTYAQVNADTSKNKIYVIHADFFRFERYGGKEYQYLSKDVLVKHKATYLLCDSAVIEGSKMVAIGHVRIVEGDSLQIFGDSLKFDGELQKADFVGNVVLKHRNRFLYTQFLNYDLKKRIASYFKGGQLSTDSAHLKSQRGYYYAKTEQAFFKDSVVVLMENNMSLQADSLVYDAKSQMVRYTGPTSIIQEDMKIYTDKGYYDVGNQKSYFGNQPQYRKTDQEADANDMYYNANLKQITLVGNAWIRDSTQEAKADSIIFDESTDDVFLFNNAYYKEGERVLRGEIIRFNRRTESLKVEGRSDVVEGARTIYADQLNYDGKQDAGVAIGKVIVSDTSSGYTVYSDTLWYSKSNNYFRAGGRRPYVSTPFDNDTLYLSADSLNSEQFIEGTDTFRVLRAFRDVKIWGKKLQGICDSLYYSGKDSVFYLHYDPVLWSDTSQFTGDTILMAMQEKSLKEIILLSKAFIINESAVQLTNQLKGRDIVAHFSEKKLKTMDINGNAESVYFIQEDDKGYIGTNYIQCSSMLIQFNEEEKVDKIHFFTKPLGDMLPMKDGQLKFLEGFKRRTDEKPNSLEDILK
jgi:lipopolysaccharide transport protein LptA